MAEKRMAKQVARTKPKRQQPRLDWPRHRPSWEQRFKELESFKQEFGHCNVPARYPPNPALGRWVVNVRFAKKHGSLAEERVHRLDALGFCWELKLTVTAGWKQRINDLKAFKKEHGHCTVPGAYQPNPALGRWVLATRRRMKQGELDKEKIRYLNALGFSWAPRDSWDRRINDLKAFKKEHGHCNVPLRYPPNPALGSWVIGLRQWKKRGMLTDDKILLLDALGFSWAMKQRGVQVSWEQRINDLKAFKKEHGHCNVPFAYRRNPALAAWVANVRQRKKRGELTEDKIRMLDDLGFCWVRHERSNPPKKPT